MKKFFLIAAIHLICPTLLVAGEVDELKKLVAIQQATISSLTKRLEVLEESVRKAELQLGTLPSISALVASNKNESKTSIDQLSAEVKGLRAGTTPFDTVLFSNGSSIIMDQGLSMILRNERTNEQLPYYYHFGLDLAAYQYPYNGQKRVIWNWQ